MEVQLLGPVSVSRQEYEIELGPPRERALFAVLAAQAGVEVARQEIINAVWGEDPPATVESSVYTYVAGLRRRLEPDRALRAPSRLLVNVGSGYLLKIDPAQVDAVCFERRISAANRLREARCFGDAVEEYDAALALWKGTAFGGAPGPFAESRRSRLNELRFTAVEDRAELLLLSNRPTEVIGDLSSLTHLVPMRERARHLLMVALYRSGRQADALAEFRDVRDLLISELGIEPGEDLQRTHEQILRGLPDVVLHMRDAPGDTAEDDGAAERVPVPPSVPAQLPRDVPGFTGRCAEMELLRRRMDGARDADECGLILITGAPGVGKTGLALHFGHEIRAHFPDGQLFVDLRGYSADPPMSGAEALCHLLGELGETSVLSDDIERRSARYRSLLAGKRVLIVLDNAADADQVRPLLPGTPSSLVVATSRNQLPGLAARDGADRVFLRPLPEADAVSLSERVLGEHSAVMDRVALEELARACSCLPLALRYAAERIIAADGPSESITGALWRIVERPDLLTRGAEDGEAASIGGIFSWSYRALPPEAARMFRLFGLHGGTEFSLRTATVLLGAEAERTADVLNVLVQANLLQSCGADRFRIAGLLHRYAGLLCEEQEHSSERSTVVRRLLAFYLHRAQQVVALLAAERGGDPAARAAVCEGCGLRSADQATDWFETELPSLTTAVEQAAATGAARTAAELSAVIRSFMLLRDGADDGHLDSFDELGVASGPVGR